LLASVQVRSALVFDPADPSIFGVVVKNFDRKELDLSREHQAHNQGARPELLPMFSRASHSDFALS